MGLDEHREVLVIQQFNESLVWIRSKFLQGFNPGNLYVASQASQVEAEAPTAYKVP
jgi:hypothetical protein